MEKMGTQPGGIAGQFQKDEIRNSMDEFVGGEEELLDIAWWHGWRKPAYFQNYGDGGRKFP